jgi:hypothetical protein
MATFTVKTTIIFTGEVEADSLAEAEELGYYYDNLNYDSVYEVEVEEVEVCEECFGLATVYAMGRGSGDWGGYYCDTCIPTGFMITDRLSTKG